jgi:hypothetical protein
MTTWRTKGTRKADATMATVRTAGGPSSQPTHAGANQTSPPRRARSPSGPGRLNAASMPASTRLVPAVRNKTSATADCWAYVGAVGTLVA